MAYVPGCRFDVFVSYASENNRDGWVEQLAGALGHELEDLLGKQFSAKESVFLDRTSLRTGQNFPDMLTEAARESALLIPILSPSYLTSDWCDREREAFFGNLPLDANPSECLLPVLARPVEPQSLMPLFRDTQWKRFLGPSDQTPWQPHSAEWKQAVTELAAAVRDSLKNLRRKYRPVFLGRVHPSDRMRALRDCCQKELERQNFRVVPESYQEFHDEAAVIRHLQSAAVSVHFLGRADVAALQAIQLAAETSAGAVILYQPFGTCLDPEEEVWLDEFEKDLRLPSNRYQRLAGKNDQELLALLRHELARGAAPASTPGLANLLLGVVCEETDFELARRLSGSLSARNLSGTGFPTFLSSSMGPSERLRNWCELIRASKGLLFCWGASKHDRLQSIWKLADSHKHTGQRQWFLAPPDLDIKKLRHPDGLYETQEVEQFLERLSGEQA
ncbi:MAG: toll/interleukin-1 receptor domain-containing protein [Bryobacteraceae bacterium]|nr:toll/interleukin-1 receptor domain-containing protein [Bryobacteraceae bacterium]